VANRGAKVQHLNERLADMQAQIQEGNVAIAEALRLLAVQPGGTIVEVYRMKGLLLSPHVGPLAAAYSRNR
jgi:hypothetical protein